MPAKKDATKRTPRKRVRTAADKLYIREVNTTERGRKVSYFRVEGYVPGGGRIRKRFPTLEEAEGELARQRVKVTNDDTAIHTVNTFLSADQVRDAEAASARLKGRYTLQEAVQWFLLNYAPPEETARLEDKLAAFLDSKEHAGVRARSARQLRATCKGFIAWATIHLLPEELASDLRQARAAVPVGSKATAIRIVKELAVVNPDYPRPAAHEITTEHIRQYLGTIKAKDGVAQATKKTFNNYRADLHTFFAWLCDPQRRFTSANPVSAIPKLTEGRGLPTTLTVAKAQELMNHVATFEDGKLIRYFALALFAGIRTGPGGELHKLAASPEVETLIDLPRRVIHIQPATSKTGDYRQVIIRPNLYAWLKASSGPILPSNHDRLIKAVRAKFQLPHDVLRHTFFSMHVAAFKSIGEAALEGGNTEAIIKRHYLNLANYTEGTKFWGINPLKNPRQRT